MVNLRGLGSGHNLDNIGASSQAGAAAAAKQKKKEELKERLKNLTPREARKHLEKEIGRDIDDPAEREIINKLTEEIRNNAEKYVG
ncbi:MAG: hypothetical protein ABIH39_06810 [Candidatus Margulisiibacteriota bacterium]